MADTLTLALAQLNPTVGAIDDNLALLRRARAEAGDADVLLAPELALAGYPPEDLVLKRAFQDGIETAVHALAVDTADGGPAMIIGAPWRVDGELYNAALVLDDGAVQAAVLKHHLPNYGVFDEIRVFAAGSLPEPVELRGTRLGVMVCEDMWFADVAGQLAEKGAEMLLVLNASPFESDKHGVRLEHARARVAETGLPLGYVNQVGGARAGFAGPAASVTAPLARLQGAFPRGQAQARRAVGGEHERGAVEHQLVLAADLEPLCSIYHALVVGIRDYVGKNRFPGVLIGMSGGIDSALSAAVAVDALGPERVHCVMMPSPYTSQESLDDANAAAGRLGVRLDQICIEPAMRAFDTMLREHFTGHNADTTEENVQARSRGITLMALSNKFGHMVLSTGNKSEMSVGYATLYGDMCGGYNVLKDVYKTTVFALARWRNAHRPEGARGPTGTVVPQNIIDKPPTAELKPNQTDQDSLPPYDVLDDILQCLIEHEMARPEIVARGHDPETVQRVWRLLDLAEYKRRQAPPGVKITGRAFGRDRRYPITNAFRG